jgi:hypothetical protein
MLARGSRQRRIVLLVIYITVTLAIFVGTTAFALKLWISRGDLDIKIALVGDIVTAGTLLLAVVAGFIALQAFATATGLPNLKIQLWFDSSNKNRPIFVADKLSNGWLEADVLAGQTHARVRLLNRSNYAARDIAVMIQLNGMVLAAGKFCEKDGWWAADNAGDSGIVAVQWDGGSDYLVHGHSARRLPDLDLGVILCTGIPETSFLEVHIMASPGYRRTVKVPVVFVTTETSGFGGPEGAASLSSANWL